MKKKIYFAPMEGLTDSIYRRLHHKYFSGIDRYYMPFMSPTVHRSLTPREQRELPPAQSTGFCAVPQLLTKNAEDFLWAARVCGELGYEEVNLNLGCPSGTVVSKGKGSGMLKEPDVLRAFLDDIFVCPPLPISIKTRLGLENSEEFEKLLAVYNDYPIAELTIHPRVRKEFYDPILHMDVFSWACQNSKNSLCYNGDLKTLTDLERFSAEYPQIESLMIGRGLIGNPGLFTPGGTTAPVLEAFMNELVEEYTRVFGSSRNAMFRMKENWTYLIHLFEGGDKLGKKLRKTTDVGEYKALTHEIITTLPIKK